MGPPRVEREVWLDVTERAALCALDAGASFDQLAELVDNLGFDVELEEQPRPPTDQALVRALRYVLTAAAMVGLDATQAAHRPLALALATALANDGIIGARGHLPSFSTAAPLGSCADEAVSRGFVSLSNDARCESMGA
ncbi:MAG: hypothetical protein KC468_25910 [Myxococcales bacterium]|nr:hypothetical protein [Myxococcales bacterium]